MQVKEIETFISKIPDYPKPGILFYDISTLLSNGKAFKSAINHLETLCLKYEFDLVAGIDARGFIFGTAISSVDSMSRSFTHSRGSFSSRCFFGI